MKFVAAPATSPAATYASTSASVRHQDRWSRSAGPAGLIRRFGNLPVRFHPHAQEVPARPSLSSPAKPDSDFIQLSFLLDRFYYAGPILKQMDFRLAGRFGFARTVCGCLIWFATQTSLPYRLEGFLVRSCAIVRRKWSGAQDKISEIHCGVIKQEWAGGAEPGPNI